MTKKIKKVTNVSRKFIGVPKTNEEKFERLKIMNPEIENLRDTFELDIEL